MTQVGWVGQWAKDDHADPIIWISYMDPYMDPVRILHGSLYGSTLYYTIL